MNPINNYRFGSYALLAIGLINLRYQTGSEANLPKSLVLIIGGLIVFGITFIASAQSLLLKKRVKQLALLALVGAVVYSFLI